MLKTKKKGFTIVELVIVIAVIAILAAVLIPTFATVIKNAEKSTAMQACKSAYSEYLSDVAGGKVSNMKGVILYYDADRASNAAASVGKSDYSFTCNTSTGQFNGTADASARTWPTTGTKYYANGKVAVYKIGG